MRTLAVLAALLLAGIGLARLTAPRTPAAVAPPVEKTAPPRESAATFELLLSGRAKRVVLDAGRESLAFENTAGPLTGKLSVEGDAPTIFLQAEWADAAAGHRFAKIRLEIPGRETREHVFTAPGDIDDLWEP